MNKLELAIDAARNDDMGRVIKLLEEALAEQAEQEPMKCVKCNAEVPLYKNGMCEVCDFNSKQAEQEPTGYLYEYKSSGEIFSGVFTDDFDAIAFNCGYNIRPLYTRPVRTKDPCHPWQDLTDDEIEAIFEYWYSQPETEVWSTVDLARAVIAKFKEKNK